MDKYMAGNTFTFLRNDQTVVYSGHTILHSHQQYVEIPLAPHPRQCSVWSIF